MFRKHGGKLLFAGAWHATGNRQLIFSCAAYPLLLTVGLPAGAYGMAIACTFCTSPACSAGVGVAPF